MKLRNRLIMIALILIGVGIIFGLMHMSSLSRIMSGLGSVFAVVAFFVGIITNRLNENKPKDEM